MKAKKTKPIQYFKGKPIKKEYKIEIPRSEWYSNGEIINPKYLKKE